MKICVLTESLDVGGAERIAVNLANGFDAAGHNVSLAVADQQGPLKSKVSQNVIINELSSVSSMSILSIIPSLAHHLSKTKPDVILSTKTHENIAAIMSCKVSMAGTKCVIRENGSLFHPLNEDCSVSRKVGIKLAKRVYPFADACVPVSNGVEKQISDIIEDNTTKQIYNPIITSGMEQSSKDQANFEIEDDILILGVGRLVPAKNFSLLIRAFKHSGIYDRAKLVILGEGPERSDLERLINDLNVTESVSLPGFKHNPYRYMSGADVFVLSSDREGLPTVLVEAMLYDCYIISTDCRYGPREILQNGEYGQLVETGNREQMSHELQKYVDIEESPETRERAQKFSSEEVVPEYIGLFKLIQ